MKIGNIVLRSFVTSLNVLGHVEAILTNPYQYTHGLPFSGPQVAGTVRRLVRGGYLAREGRGPKAVYRLTERGERRVRERMSRFLVKPVAWDGKWRMVIFDIEESERKTRDRLRRFLKSLGFGRLQLSIWISPFPVREILEEFLRQSGLGNAALIVEAGYVGWETSELSSRLWGIPALTKMYQEFANECDQAKRVTRDLREEFVRLVVLDPFLPDGLSVYGSERKRAFQAYNTLLSKEMFSSIQRSSADKNISEAENR